MSTNGIKCGVPIYDFPVPSWNRGKKQTYQMKPEKIVIHNTYNHAKAKAEASYMVGNSNWTSFHTVIDDNMIIECIPFTRNAWHCGNQYGNRNYIGIEIAKSTGNIEEFKKAEINTAKYVAAILKHFGWDTGRVVSHKYCSGKYCPHKTLDLGWNRFIQMIKNEMNNISNTNHYTSAKKEGGYSVKTNTPGDVLNVRIAPNVSTKIVSTYSHGSKIYVHDVIKNNQGTWFKIEYRKGSFGFVSARYCVGLK